MAYAKACVQPAYSYFKLKFDHDLRPALLAFKAARYFSPSKLHELKPTANDLDSLQAFPFFDHEIIEGLKSELPLYLAAAEDSISPVRQQLYFWGLQQHVHFPFFPNWRAVHFYFPFPS